MDELEEKINELVEILWNNYYTLMASPAQAMADLWSDYAQGNLFPWANEEWGISEAELLGIIAILTVKLNTFENTMKPMVNPN